MKRISLVAAVAALAVACGGPSKKPAPVAAKPADPVPAATQPIDQEPELPLVPSAPVAAPDGLLATAQVGDARALLAAAAAFADQIKPGAGAALTLDRVVEGLAQDGMDLRGADLGKPIRLIVLDPSMFNQPLIAVFSVADEKLVREGVEQHGLRVQIHGDVAAVGTYEALVAAGGFALTTLASAPPPAHPTADVDVARLMQKYAPMLDMLFANVAQMSDPTQRATMEATMRLYAALFRQIDHLQLSLELVGDHASVITRMTALTDSPLAAFIGKQAPATFALLEQTPAGLVAMGGHLDLGQVWAAMTDMIEPSMTTTYGDAAPALMAFWKRWVELDTGENAVTVDVNQTSFGMSGLWDVAQPAAAATMWTDYLAMITKTPIAAVTFKPSSAKYKGGKISLVTMVPGKGMPEPQKAFFDRLGGKMMFGFGVVDKRVYFSMGTDALPRAKALIDRSKRKAAPAKSATQIAIAEARQRGESYLMTIDIAALKGIFVPQLGNGPGAAPAGSLEPAAFAIGTADGALTMRFTVPAAQAKAFAEN